jgi:hypothetical protein
VGQANAIRFSLRSMCLTVISLLRSEISQLWEMWTAYNPGRHYMRGPGPKWREKHGMLGGLHMQIDGSERVISSGGKSLRQLRRSPLE